MSAPGARWPSARAAVVLAAARGVAGCGPLVEPAPFAVRPDSVRPADLLGPYDGIVARRRLGPPGRRARRSPRPGRSRAASASRRRSRRARGGGRDRRRRPLHDPAPRRPARGGLGAHPPLHAGRLPPRPRRLAERPALPRPARAGATSASAATACGSKAGSRPTGTPSTWSSWAAARRCARPPPGSCRRRRWSSRASACRPRRAERRGRRADRGRAGAARHLASCSATTRSGASPATSASSRTAS